MILLFIQANLCIKVNMVSEKPKYNLILKRTMTNVRQLVSKYMPKGARHYSSLASGTFKPSVQKPPVVAADVSGKHKVVVITACKNSECKTTNCAQMSPAKTPCPGGNTTVHQYGLATNGTTTFIVGNLTSKVPLNKTGFTVDPNMNYSSESKEQQIVVEPTPVQVKLADIHMDPQSTAYMQQKTHHNKIANQTQIQDALDKIP